MLTEQEIGTVLDRINPVSYADEIPAGTERLWASIEAKRTPLSVSPNRRQYRLRVALVIVGLSALAAAPSVASWFDADTPPLDSEFDSGTNSAVTVYGTEDGVPDGCAWQLAIAPGGTPLVAGSCGVLEFDGRRWSVLADHEAIGQTPTGLAVEGAKTLWIATPDQPLRSVTDGAVTEMEITSPWVAVGPDGTAWAVDYGLDRRGELVAYSEGAWRSFSDTAMVNDIAIGSEGDTWFLAGNELAQVSDDLVTVIDFDHPEGMISNLNTSADGAVWLVVATDDVIERTDVTDAATYIVRLDGKSTTNIEVPFAEISDFAATSDGTIWASSSLHGLFVYDGDVWTRYSVADGLPSDQVHRVEFAPDGSVFATTSGGVVRIRPTD